MWMGRVVLAAMVEDTCVGAGLSCCCVFCRATLALSFSGATRGLCISRSTVSRYVRRLRRSLRLGLFMHSQGKMALAGRNRLLLRGVRPTVRTILRKRTLLREILRLRDNVLAVTTKSSITARFLLPCLRGFRTLCPSVEVRVTGSCSSRLLSLMGRKGTSLTFIGLPTGSRRLYVAPYFSVSSVFIYNRRCRTGTSCD